MSMVDATAYGSKCLFAEIAIPCTIYLSLYLHSFYIYQHRSTDLLLGFTLLQYTIATHILPFLSIKNSKLLIQWTNIRKN